MQHLILATLLLLAASSASADYLRAGPVKAHVCRGFLIEVCRPTQIDAVSEDGKNFFMPIEEFVAVDEFDSRLKLCHVRTRSGWWHWALGFIVKTTRFYETGSDGAFVQVYPEYVSFACEDRAS
jgi:hypothetical protein